MGRYIDKTFCKKTGNGKKRDMKKNNGGPYHPSQVPRCSISSMLPPLTERKGPIVERTSSIPSWRAGRNEVNEVQCLFHKESAEHKGLMKHQDTF